MHTGVDGAAIILHWERLCAFVVQLHWQGCNVGLRIFRPLSGLHAVSTDSLKITLTDGRSSGGQHSFPKLARVYWYRQSKNGGAGSEFNQTLEGPYRGGTDANYIPTSPSC
ncbi:hypothetical protein BDV26DRAFT_257407 [Aspergillus bertholletiae]|uniref:Uncharacterized protein n=1 Tax=Aspergillus bertholletiae TaxID=1226010 RepID=A0A5N7BFD3_9EURO|nr:hypothetical protein BDV26DRAFT_257407 [Aspergillus bertholletiae]